MSKSKNLINLIGLDEKLLLTSNHKKNAEDGKAVGFIDIDPMDFLKLTTNNKSEIDQIISESESVSFYNEQAKSGNNIIAPFLQFDSITGDVNGHEGRHRAGALVKEGVKKMKIALYPTHHKWFKVRNWKTDHFENFSRFYGQFNSSVVVKVNFKKIEPILANWNRGRGFKW